MSRFIVIALLLVSAAFTHADIAPYHINPGDILLVYVWNEKDLSQETLVHPDGKISVPLAGQLMAGGLTAEEVQNSLAEALGKFMKDKPSVTISIKQTAGNIIYVLGKVNRPGMYPMVGPTDVMQALAIGGGLTPYAAENGINVLHREKNGSQTAIKFRYSDVKGGDELKTNILLNSGDVVVVP